MPLSITHFILYPATLFYLVFLSFILPYISTTSFYYLIIQNISYFLYPILLGALFSTKHIMIITTKCSPPNHISHFYCNGIEAWSRFNRKPILDKAKKTKSCWYWVCKILILIVIKGFFWLKVIYNYFDCSISINLCRIYEFTTID